MKFTDLFTQSADFFDGLQTDDIRIKVAGTPDDRKKVKQLRSEGYKMYFGSRASKSEGEEDLKPNETTYLALDKLDNPVGTIRVLDRRKGDIELDHFLDVDNLLKKDEHPCAEATRFTISKHPQALVIKLLLWRAYLDYCRNNKIKTALISSRKILAKNYEFLLFKDLGKKGVYHHSHLRNKEHRTFKMNIPGMPNLWRQEKQPLYRFMFARQPKSIEIDSRNAGLY